MRRIFKRLLDIALLGLLCATALFAESFTSAYTPAWLRAVLVEIRAASRDPGTQWMVYACAVIYFVTFTVLLKRGVRSAERGTRASTPHPLSLSPVEAEREERGTTCNLQPATCNFFATPDLWLGGLLLIATLHYALNYATASGSTQALMLMVGAAIGKGARLWATWRNAECGTRSAELGAMCQVRGNIEPRTLNIEPRTSSDAANLQPATCNLQRLLAALLLLLAGASLWHPETAMQFQYRGLSRWSGPWDNPNIFGLLMGTGVVLACGLLVASCRLKVAGSFTDELPLRLARGEGWGEVSSVSGSPPRRGKGWVPWLWRLLLFACLACCAVGLLKSYSRGAWLGTALGLAVLAFQVLRLQLAGSKGRPLTPSLSPSEGERVPGGRVRGTLLCNSYVSWLSRNWLQCSILLASILVLCFWQFRYTEFHPVRRAFSVGNQNDFSWRNRVAAWEGSLAMMADKPLVGFGWNKPERIYDQFYRPPKVSEGMAIQLNHYFILGMSLGLPALICFGMYVGLALRGNGGWGMASGVWGKEDGERSALNLQCWGTHPRPLRGGDLGTGESGNLDTSPSIPLPDRGGEGGQASTLNHQLLTTCRAAVVVLLVGLWFDGGLFNLATASVFWVLLEVGRVTPCVPFQGGANKGENP